MSGGGGGGGGGGGDSAAQVLYGITRDQIAALNVDQDDAANRARLAALGGPRGLAAKLSTDLRAGLAGADGAARAAAFGRNELPQPEEETWLEVRATTTMHAPLPPLCSLPMLLPTAGNGP